MKNEGKLFVETCKPCFSNRSVKTSNNIIQRDVRDVHFLYLFVLS